MAVLDFDRLSEIAQRGRAAFAGADPFPHVVIDDFLPEEVAESVRCEFDQAQSASKHYSHGNEKKLALTDLAKMPAHTQALYEDLLSPRFVSFITDLTGIDQLVSDRDLEGAGMHMTLPGGFLNIHTDFLTHPKRRHWRRQVNLLIYLNRDWQDDWQGNLELWTKDMKECAASVAPVFNRCVIFNTLRRSYHGHPHRLACPPGESRKSIAIYYYCDAGVPGKIEPTDYQPLPTDSRMKRALIRADRGLLALYTYIKGRSGISDETLSRFLKRF